MSSRTREGRKPNAGDSKEDAYLTYIFIIMELTLDLVKNEMVAVFCWPKFNIYPKRSVNFVQILGEKERWQNICENGNQFNQIDVVSRKPFLMSYIGSLIRYRITMSQSQWKIHQPSLLPVVGNALLTCLNYVATSFKHRSFSCTVSIVPKVV